MRSVAVAFTLIAFTLGGCQARDRAGAFDGERALRAVQHQLSLGPRIPGSDGAADCASWIESSLDELGWQTSVQSSTHEGVTLNTVIGKRGIGSGPPILVGTHYDTRPMADRDMLHPELPVPGANDGASGVAVLLELARVLPEEPGAHEIWLVFFDGEDSGNLDGWEWSVGAAAFAAGMDVTPQAVVIVDMVGDADLRLPRERSSDRALADEIWGVARDLGAPAFVDETRGAILDDHRPFAERGIPSVLIIDLDYPYWHTTEDTLDRVSAESLEQVGSVLYTWILTLR